MGTTLSVWKAGVRPPHTAEDFTTLPLESPSALSPASQAPLTRNMCSRPTAKKFAEMQPKKEAAPSKKEKPAKEPAKPKEKKKEEKKAAPAADEEMDECEAALAAEPKSKDPFAHLPKRYSPPPVQSPMGRHDRCRPRHV